MKATFINDDSPLLYCPRHEFGSHFIRCTGDGNLHIPKRAWLQQFDGKFLTPERDFFADRMLRGQEFEVAQGEISFRQQFEDQRTDCSSRTDDR
jgi:hypothetical protein